MPKSKAAKQRQRVTQESNSLFVAQQLKNHLFGNENPNNSDEDLSGEEDNTNYYDEDVTTMSPRLFLPTLPTTTLTNQLVVSQHQTSLPALMIL